MAASYFTNSINFCQRGGQPRQQLAFAAAKIQDTRFGLNNRADDGVVAASEQIRDERFGHS